MEEKTIIQGNGKRYLSELPEFSNGLPFGIINKKITDVGGTFAAVNCSSNYIVVVPTKDLTISIQTDENNKYEVFKMHGGILKTSFKEYLSKNQIKKIAVTYNSFEKLTEWLISLGQCLDDYKILIDEFHLLLEEMDFRDEAISKLIDNVIKFKHYSFLSATPINSDFEFDFLKQLPHYEVNWGDTVKIQPFRIKTPNVYKGAINLIQEFNKGLVLDTIDGSTDTVKELHIFMNSVNGISQICNSAEIEPENVRIICSDNIKNNMVLSKYPIGLISDKNKPINFYTKKGFRGCNVFSNNALIVVISDSQRAHTLIDIETALTQITGRIRLNDKSKNIFRHKIYHIYSTNSKLMSDEDFKDFIEQQKNDDIAICNDLMSKDEELRKIYFKRWTNWESGFLSKKGNTVYFNERKEHLFNYKHKLKKVYKDGLSVRSAYLKNSKFLDSKQEFSMYDEIICNKIATIKLEDLYNSFLESEDKEMYRLEYPEFFEYEQYLSVSEMSSKKWNKEKIEKLLIDKKCLNVAHKKVQDRITTSFISKAEVKNIYSSIFNDLGIKLAAKGTLIENNPFLKVSEVVKKIDNKSVRGYSIEKYKFNF